MFWENCDIQNLEINGKKFVKLVAADVITNKSYWVYITDFMYNELKSGKNFNETLKDCDFNTKLFLATGQGLKTKSFFEFDRQINRKAYITNSVAHSVAYYAFIYISHYRNIEKEEWRLKDVDYFKNQFLTQSKEFLSLYNEMVKSIDIFLSQFTIDELQKYFNDIDILNVKKQFTRKVYHTHLECEYMRSDYNEESYHPNTGVFYENALLKGTNIYCLDEEYLKELGMRECKICSKLS